ncbi:hypothetical protein D3C85_272650 [compost metagenome]
MTVQVVNKVETIQRTSVVCPKCSHHMHVHWYVGFVLSDRKKAEGKPPTFEATCGGCDVSYEFFVHSPTDIDFKEIPTKQFSGLMLVKRPDEELYMVVEQNFYVRNGKVDLDNEFWINESTCPTNWFKVLLVAEDGDPDPHGVFQWVRALTYVEIKEKFGYERDFLRGEGDDPNAVEEAILHIFPEIANGGTFMEGEAVEVVNVIPLALEQEVPAEPTVTLLREIDDWPELIDLLHYMGDHGLSEEQVDHCHDMFEYQPHQPTHRRTMKVYRAADGLIRLTMNAYNVEFEQWFQADTELLARLQTQ